ncbi:hypothetical protein [Mobilicoccus pelagius]|uniref:EAL domain-containing protein n=1 Tax=Mobilicoccus pelagius NBRC 104925 TaxID=1089455 RepID=H5UVM3_9MICO|nr:hypothetical protein [Mobilicoccus pelagius]GAB49781.1 hypothetical protein MOPEL_135_00190 [Mobilicoccus pelagius NBRC 104925]
MLAPLVGGSGFPAGLVGMIHPTLDVFLLTLADLGCPMVQGWLYVRPEPAVDILRRDAGTAAADASHRAGTATSA